MDAKIYLDYNATTPLAPEVVTAITTALTDAWANPSSSSELGQRAKQVVNQARASVAKMLGAEKDSDVLFTSGGTEANNQVLWTALEYFKSWLVTNGCNESAKPHIITTNVEHDAILLPLKHFEAKKWADVDFIPVCKKTGQILTEDVLKSIKSNTCLISVMLANNETGVIMPVSEISRQLQQLNEKREREGRCRVYLHTDAAQALGKIPVDVKDLGVDYLTIVGHKFYGPRNGALYVRDLGDGEKGVPLYPMLFGGGQERSYRPGTENTPIISGLGRASELVSANLKSFQHHMSQMRNLLQDLLLKEFGEDVVFNCGESERLPNTCNVSFKRTQLTGGEILGRCPSLMASTGAACHGTGKPSSILLASGVSLEDARTAVRLSVGRDTTAEEVRRVVEMLASAIREAEATEATGTSSLEDISCLSLWHENDCAKCARILAKYEKGGDEFVLNCLHRKYAGATRVIICSTIQAFSSLYEDLSYNDDEEYLEKEILVALPSKRRYRSCLRALKDQLELQYQNSSIARRIPIEDENVPAVIYAILELVAKHEEFKEAEKSGFQVHQELVRQETRAIIQKMAMVAAAIGEQSCAEILDQYFYNLDGAPEQMTAGMPIKVNRENLGDDEAKLKLTPFASFLAHKHKYT